MQQHKFKPFEKVISTSTNEKDVWTCGIYSHENDKYYVINGVHLDKTRTLVLPYDENEHLVGTHDIPQESVEVNLELMELIVVFDNLYDLAENNIDVCISSYIGVENGMFKVTVNNVWKYAIPFEKFNPKDMASTWKEVLYVSYDGKIRKANYELIGD